MSESTRKDPAVFEDREVDRTLHAEAGEALFVCVNWSMPAVSLIQLRCTDSGTARFKRANERGLELVVPLPVPAILESAWLVFCEEARPLLERAKLEWRPVMGGSGAYFRGILSPAGQEIQRAIIEKVATIEPGDGVLTPVSAEVYLREMAMWHRERFVYSIPGLGEVGPMPNYPKILEMASKLDEHARRNGCVLTEDGHYELVALAEHACCEYLDPANYSPEVQAEAAAIDEELFGKSKAT